MAKVMNSSVASRSTVNANLRVPVTGSIGGSQAGSAVGNDISGPLPFTSTVTIDRISSSEAMIGMPGISIAVIVMLDCGVAPATGAGMPGMIGFWLEPGVSMS